VRKTIGVACWIDPSTDRAFFRACAEFETTSRSRRSEVLGPPAPGSPIRDCNGRSNRRFRIWNSLGEDTASPRPYSRSQPDRRRDRGRRPSSGEWVGGAALYSRPHVEQAVPGPAFETPWVPLFSLNESPPRGSLGKELAGPRPRTGFPAPRRACAHLTPGFLRGKTRGGVRSMERQRIFPRWQPETLFRTMNPTGVRAGPRSCHRELSGVARPGPRALPPIPT